MEIKDNNLQPNSFENRKEMFSNNEIPRITCETLEERDAALASVGATIGDLENLGELNGKIIFCRSTDKENIFVEDILDPNDKRDVTWLIYRADLEDDN